MSQRKGNREVEPLNITVVLCTYNRCESLAKALESVAQSTVPAFVQWEVLTVDNNSKDRTQSVVEGFCRRYPGRFRYVFEPQQGKSYALNAGIQESQSPILAFADDDATVEPDWLWNLTSNLHSGEWAGSGGRIIPVWTKPIPRWLSLDDPHTMGPFVAFDAGTEAGVLNCAPYGANMAFRREKFETYGGFRTDLGPRPGSEIRGEDIEFANRLLAAGERLRYEPQAIVFHPVPESRMRKAFVLKWWFWFGYGEVMQLSPPSGARWMLHGVPIYLFRRLVRWVLQWMITFNPPRRFSCIRYAWYLAGIIRACYQRPRRQAAQLVTGGNLLGEEPEQSALKANTLR